MQHQPLTWTKVMTLILSGITINPSIVFEKLASLKTGEECAPGPDGWPVEVFKQCADWLCVPLSILLTNPLESR